MIDNNIFSMSNFIYCVLERFNVSFTLVTDLSAS